MRKEGTSQISSELKFNVCGSSKELLQSGVLGWVAEMRILLRFDFGIGEREVVDLRLCHGLLEELIDVERLFGPRHKEINEENSSQNQLQHEVKQK